MQIERDHVQIVSGVRHGETIGSPISFIIENRDWSHWETAMSPDPAPDGANIRPVSRPRPGHADLAGAIKYHTQDIRNILERASARETAARVAVGAFCKLMLHRFDVRLGSHVLRVGEVKVDPKYELLDSSEILKIDPESPMRCADPVAEIQMMSLIDQAKKAGDTLGGMLEVVAVDVPAGLGS